MERQFDYTRVKDPEYFRDSALEAHSDHVAYGSLEELCQGRTSLRCSLNGLWKFHYARNYDCTVRGFEKPEYCCCGWDDIYVPAHIQMEGYDAPQYANVQYPWEGHEEAAPGEIPQRFNPVASYVKYFAVPEQMKGERLFVSFQGAESALAVWLNGRFVGYGEDSFTPSDFELTGYLREGENKLAVQVFKWSSGSWCEDQDFFRFSGLYRDVYLYAVPETHVQDLQVRAIPDETLKTAQITVTAKLWGRGSVKAVLSRDGAGVAELTEVNAAQAAVNSSRDGEAVSGQDSADKDSAAPASACGSASGKYTPEPAAERILTLSCEIENPALWSAEDPQLYDLLLEVSDADGTLCEVIPQRVGVRRFEMKDGLMKLNGKRIVFNGVNRHEFSSVSGRCVSEEELRTDLATMKQNNINAIRTCHYPDAPLIYRLCDEYGFYLIAETNLESHGTWDAVWQSGDRSGIIPDNKPEWQQMLLDRVKSMYYLYRNHPAILIWSCGNESFGGKDIFEMSQLFRRLDPTRLVHYEGVHLDRSYNDTSDMESQMYPSAESIQAFLEKDDSKPFLCCEYSHAMGNSCGAMHKYTDLTVTQPKYQGGFIWDYIDQSIYKKDRYGKEFQAYGGDFGDRPTDYNFSGNGIAYGGERHASPKMQEVKFNYQTISAEVREDSVKVINRNLFVSTGTFDCTVTLARDGHVIRTAPLMTDVEPLSEKTYALPFGRESLPGEYTVTVSFRLKEDRVWAKAGHEVAFGQYVYRAGSAGNAFSLSDPVTRSDAARFGQRIGPAGRYSPVPEAVSLCASPEPEKLTVIHNTHNIGLRGRHFEAMFSYLNGGLVSYRYAGREMIEAIPKPNFWRAPTDNDCGNLMPARYAQWKTASLYLTHKDFRNAHRGSVTRPGMYAPAVPPVLEERGYSAVITYTYFMPTVPASQCQLSYEVFADGSIRTTLAYDPVKELGDMPEFGVLFKLNADYNRVEWYGLGPEETYADRCRGAKLGIYRNLVSDNMAQYLVPQECGAKMGVRWAKVTDRKGRGMLFSMDPASGPMMFSALPYTPHEIENAAHPYELPEVHYTVVRAALGQMGVAGDDSWGSCTHPEYLLNAGQKMEFSFFMKGC